MHPKGTLHRFQVGIEGLRFFCDSFDPLGFGIPEGRGNFPVSANFGALTNDTALGVMRYADAQYEDAMEEARIKGIRRLVS